MVPYKTETSLKFGDVESNLFFGGKVLFGEFNEILQKFGHFAWIKVNEMKSRGILC